MPAQPSIGEIKFAYWVPNVGGDLVNSPTDHRDDDNREPAVPSENNEIQCVGRRVLPKTRELDALPPTSEPVSV